MDPRNQNPKPAPGHTPGQMESTPPNRLSDPGGNGVAPPRRMDPRLWALLPLIALAVLGAYMVGKGLDDDSGPAGRLTAAEQAATDAPPPPPPRGSITVTEVPQPVAAPPPPPAPPVLAPPPAPARPPEREPYQREEPPFVLTPPEPPEPDPEMPPVESSAETDESRGTGGESRPAEPAEPTAPREPDRDPVKLNDPALEYPASAYEAGVEGTARVSFSVTMEGRVDDARITQSSGDTRLDQAALDYVRRLRFRPATRNGKPTTVRASRNVRFQLR